jgi:hypothetical protein
VEPRIDDPEALKALLSFCAGLVASGPCLCVTENTGECGLEALKEPESGEDATHRHDDAENTAGDEEIAVETDSAGSCAGKDRSFFATAG